MQSPLDSYKLCWRRIKSAIADEHRLFLCIRAKLPDKLEGRKRSKREIVEGEVEGEKYFQ